MPLLKSGRVALCLGILLNVMPPLYAHKDWYKIYEELYQRPAAARKRPSAFGEKDVDVTRTVELAQKFLDIKVSLINYFEVKEQLAQAFTEYNNVSSGKNSILIANAKSKLQTKWNQYREAINSVNSVLEKEIIGRFQPEQYPEALIPTILKN
jgi:hypothetical protein